MPLTQFDKATSFREQHNAERLLLLPNIWDALSAKLVAALGFPSLATASASVALANGYPDGEHIPFAKLLEIVRQISGAVSLPLTVDMERGFANEIPQLKENIKLLIEAGAIGLNIEDGFGRGKGLRSMLEQCKRIEAIREVSVRYGLPLIINARTDIFIQSTADNQIEEAITRSNAYKAAGADCFYPILINNYDHLSAIMSKTSIPVNVLLLKSVSDLKKLENMGVARVSVGPQLLKLALAKIKNAAEGLLNYDTTAFFDQDMISADFIDRLNTK